jgi:hypothetical protein
MIFFFLQISVIISTLNHRKFAILIISDTKKTNEMIRLFIILITVCFVFFIFHQFEKQKDCLSKILNYFVLTLI